MPTRQGRKNCSVCTCWRPVSDFAPKAWDGETVAKLQSQCRTCANRIKRYRYLMDEEFRKMIKASHREHQAVKRRERGVAVRPVGKHNKGEYGAGRVGPPEVPVDYDTKVRRDKWRDEKRRQREVLVQD